MMSSVARKLSHGGNIYPLKACLVKVLPELIEAAVYSNYGNRKASENNIVVGYFNFNAKVEINGSVEHVHLTVQIRKDGKFYYSHELNIYKK